ncbi:MAG: endonuclease MutS2 [Clostridia bacterium]|nr:endonuclease MutS2 [Clostridia bacterium]
MNERMERTLTTLELNRVLERLSEEATMVDARALALTLRPSTDLHTVSQLLRNTDDAYKLMARYSAPSFGSAANVANALARAKVGAALSIRELLDIAEVLRIIRSVKNWRSDCASGEVSFEDLFSALNPNKYLEDKINLCIKSEEELNDQASPLLAQLRRNIAGKSSKIREILDKIIRSNTAKYLQEALITQRDGRFVVPVKSEFKNEIKGIVHDTSSSGSTLFIEPMSVVETNNEIRVLKIKEQEEITRILAELSAEAADFADSINYSYQSLIQLNLIFAKANLAYKMAGIVPKLNEKGYIYLKRARHPLIPKKNVVPITVALGGEYDSLIITGPNTGGKTVTLKAIGLLTLMAMCGLMIPADDNSEISVFNHIFADIGDEQSIEQSLSTFSSHMVNIIDILSACDDHSLALFDELCAGTDPIEGAALAKAILMELDAKGVKTVATTHYAELKSYALDTDRVENAGCEFDVATLRPTYRLLIGVPGRSNAFAISRRLGLDEGVIERASAQVSDDDLRFERVLESLEIARQSAEDEREKAARLRAELNDAKKKSDLLEHEFRIKQEKLMAQTREKAAAILDNARSQSARLLNELEDAKKQMTAENAAKMAERARAEYKRSLREIENDVDPVTEASPSGEKLGKLPNVGDIVVIHSFGRDATVLEVDANKKRCYVVSGSMKMWVKMDDLRVKKGRESTEIKKTRRVKDIASKAMRVVSGELDIRGMASDEALMELDKYIDNAVLSGLETVRIIHGKGTGVLRKTVQSHLRGHKSVESFRCGTFGEGENGVTVATLKD